jgi:hypothetical protein
VSAGRTKGRAAALALGGLLAAAAPPAAPAPAAAPRATAGAPLELSVAAFNGRFSEPGADLGAVEQGPLTLRLASPENALDVLEHRVRLEPLGDGSHRAELTAAVRGRGRLVADLSVAGGAPGRLVDEVVLPAQSVAVEGRVRLAPGAEGYTVVPLELPRAVYLEIESALAGRLVGLCSGVALLVPGGADCRGLERALGRVTVPLPEAGEELLLPYAALAAAERDRLDRYLARAGAP